MDKKQLTQQIKEPYSIREEEIKSLENILTLYPYFHAGQILLSKGLLNTKSLRYNRQLKKAACYCSNRKKLFHLITLNPSDPILEKNKKDKTQEDQFIANQPLIFDKDELHSFSEWLSLSKINKIERNKEEKGEEIINDFIKNPKTINRLEKKSFFKPSLAAKESLIENDEIITPTLAKVYLEQGHFDKAIYAYKKLCLKYPKKNSFFASQIKLINKLKEE